GFAFFIVLCKAFIFNKSEHARNKAAMAMPPASQPTRPLWKTGLYFLSMILFLVFSDWYNTNEVTITLKNSTAIKASVQYSTQDFIEIKIYEPDGKMAVDNIRLNRSDISEIKPEDNFVMRVNAIKWYLAGVMGLAILLMLRKWFTRTEIREWMAATWDFGMMIIPLLFGGVFVTGFIGGLLPEKAVAAFVGGNSLFSNFFASFIGALWYFATLTEIPVTQMLMRLGMGKGPALALLLAGPALSVPSILVINKIIGWRKTLVFCALVVGFSTIVGYMFGMIVH
ncbi:MAG: permease, partial [Candidatus Omnitrophota bacterium]|nr:permease [Candidatus Omnitrophota bacterium]